MKEHESVVQIDEFHLDRECIRLPNQYLSHSTQAADARRRVDEAKAALDVVESEIKQHIRANPGTYGLEKVTEGAIGELLVLRPKYQKALRELTEAKHQYDLAQAVVSALEHKKRSLTLLVDLHGTGYFAEVRPSLEGKRAVEKMGADRLRRPIAPKRERKKEDNED